MGLAFLVGSIVKIVALMVYLWALLRILAHPKWWVKVIGVIAAFGIVQIALTSINGFTLLLTELTVQQTS